MAQLQHCILSLDRAAAAAVQVLRLLAVHCRYALCQLCALQPRHHLNGTNDTNHHLHSKPMLRARPLGRVK